MTSPYNEKVNKLNTALENVYLKKADFIDELEDTLDGIDSEYQKQNIGVDYANKNVVTDSNGIITTENKPTIPSASFTRPSADTTSGETGSSSDFARADHTHPKSTLYAQSNHNHTGLTQMTSIQGSFASTQQRSIFNRPQQGQWTFIDNKISYDGTNITYNSSEIATLDDIPTSLSDLNDDLGIITSHNPIDTELSSTSTNAVQNKVIQTALNGKANIIHNHANIPTKTSDLLNNGDGVNSFITQSSINGLVKNDGTIDTNIYLTTHQDITGKVNITDIKDNLTSTDTDKPLSAKQGKWLKDNTASVSHDHDHIGGGMSGVSIFDDTDGVGMYALGDKIIYDWSNSDLVYYDKNGMGVDGDNEIATKGDIFDAVGDAITYINS